METEALVKAIRVWTLAFNNLNDKMIEITKTLYTADQWNYRVWKAKRRAKYLRRYRNRGIRMQKAR